MSLSEQELLLLDCFMYSDLAPKSNKGDTLEDIINGFVDEKTGEISMKKIKSSGLQFSGDMDAKSFKDILIDMKQSKSLMKLKLMETTPEYKGSIRAACFVDDTGKATVAFRGTGGSYRQWYNNLEGYGELSQETQDAAATFINSLPYTGIDVTGHSNGGDQAMYVSIVCADKVSRCVSYEGQGVSDEFMHVYSDEVEKNKHKIKKICGEKDFVSPLLNNIAGETVYVKSDSDLLGGCLDHGAYGIYKANSKALKNNGGNFPETAYVEQAWYCKAIHGLSIVLSKKSNNIKDGPVIEFLTDFAGIAVGLIMNKNYKDPESIEQACKDLIVALKDLGIGSIEICIEAINYVCANIITCVYNLIDVNGKITSIEPRVTVDTYKLNSYAQRIKYIQTRITRLDKRLNALYLQVGLLDLWNLSQADILIGYSWRLECCANYLNDTATDYTNIENDIASKVQ